jgi:hypothetical protein
MIHLAPLAAAVLHLIQAVPPNAVTPFQWASNYIHVVAWPTICFAIWKVSKAATKFVDRLDKTVTQIDHMATNHFPHMEASLTEIATILRERKSL